MRYITKAEIDGNISRKLLRRMDCFIAAIRSIFSIHHMASGSHTVKSYHYKDPCEAADGHTVKEDFSRKPTDEDIEIMAGNLTKLVNKPNKTLFEQAVIARLCGFHGIGMYPNWKPKPGLHLDIRPVENATFWLGFNKAKLQKLIDESDEEQIYFYLT